MRCLLFAALLLLCCAYGCVATVYTRPVWPWRGDSIWGTYVVKGVAPTISESDKEEWGIMNLAVDSRRLLNEFEFCERSGKEGRIDGESEGSAYNEKKWEAPEEEVTLVREVDHEECDALMNFTRGRAVELLQNVLPEAAKMHVDRLAIKRRVGDLNITNKTKYIREACKRYIPKKHRDSGLPNVDFVVYVGLWNDETSTTICSFDEKTGRPTSAVIRFKIGDLDKLKWNRTESKRHAIRVAAHEIAHGLGFSTKANKFSELLNVTEDGEHMELVSEEIKKTLGKYGCGDAKGIRIDDNSMDKPYPHFDGSIAKNELMSPYNVTDEPTGMFYSDLTLAVFESTGYYKADYGKSEKGVGTVKLGCTPRGDH